MTDPKVKLHEGDCTKLLPNLKDQSVHLVLTDPPYFLHGLDDKWDHDAVKASKERNYEKYGGWKMPSGMAFDMAQGHALQEFMQPVAEQLFRVLKPGGFLLCFSGGRLTHRMGVAIEDAGFEIRDLFIWHYPKSGLFKAFTINHFLKKRKDLSPKQKRKIEKSIGGRRTPMLRPQFESIICAQKSRDGTFIDNWMEHQTGLIDATQALPGRKVPETVMTVEKHRRDYDAGNEHFTPKPMLLCEHLIRLFSVEGQTVLDPFLGSGTTCLAAKRCGRSSIGMEKDSNQFKIASERVKKGRVQTDLGPSTKLRKLFA